jgi:hypothetical protein
LEALAVDPYLTKATQMVGGGRGIDLGKVEQSYLRSRDRTLAAIRNNAGKSYGVREEHRVNLELLQAIAAILETPLVQVGAAKPMTPGIGNPFFFLPTEDVFAFLEYNFLRFIIPFETIARSTARQQHVPWEKTKLMVTLLRCLPSAFGSALLRDKSALWKSQVTDASTGSQSFGLGMGETLERFGFCWLLQRRIDWRIGPRITKKFIFNDRDLLKSYKARWGRVYTVQDTYLEVNNLAQLLKRCYQVDYKDGSKRILDHLNVVCIRTYRQDVWLALKALVIFKDMEDEQKCLNGDVALTHHSIDSRRDPQKFTWFFPQPCNKHNFTTFDIVDRTWYFNNEERRVWEKPYRQLFQHCVQALSRATSQAKAIEWAHQFPTAFLKYNWTFPQPSKHSFLVRDSKRRGKPLSFHTAVHIDHGLELPGVDWDDESRWEVGDAEWYLKGQAPTLPRDTASTILQHVERGLEQIRRRR